MGYIKMDHINYKGDFIMKNCCEEQELTEAIRGCIKDRATWFYLLYKEAQRLGADANEIGAKAIFKAGQLKSVKAGMCETPRQFFDWLSAKNTRLAFAMEEINVEENEGMYRFHRCALCDAWRELGCSPEEVKHLCDLASEGDYGLVSAYPLDLKFNCTIADGSDYCEMVVTKK